MDEDEVMLQFGRKKRRRGIALVVLAVVLLGVILLPSKSYAAVLALIAFASFGLFIWLDWRCPFCLAPLGREWNYTFCPHCGTRLTL